MTKDITAILRIKRPQFYFFKAISCYTLMLFYVVFLCYTRSIESDKEEIADLERRLSEIRRVMNSAVPDA